MGWRSMVKEVRREVFSGEYVCPVCGRVFRNQRSLISHICCMIKRGDREHEKLALAFSRNSRLRKKIVARYR